MSYKIHKFEVFENLVNKDSNVKVGDKLQLIALEDRYAKLAPGSIGIVDKIDDTGTLHMRWNDGSTLGLIPNIDKYNIIAKDESFNYKGYDIQIKPHPFKNAYMCQVYKDGEYQMGIKGPVNLELGKKDCIYFVDGKTS